MNGNIEDILNLDRVCYEILLYGVDVYDSFASYLHWKLVGGVSWEEWLKQEEDVKIQEEHM